MIIAYHAIFTTYGTWLPNDPRGSFSEKIYKDELRAIGDVKYGRQYPQPPKKSLRKFWTVTSPNLSRRPYFINDRTRSTVADSFATVVQRLNLAVPACAIMNDHVHILVMRSKYKIEYLAGQFKGAATHTLELKRTPWTSGCWKVFISSEDTLQSAARYIEQNPVIAGLGKQNWSFVKPLFKGGPSVHR